MKLKVFKPALAATLLFLAVTSACFAQHTPAAKPIAPADPVVKTDVKVDPVQITEPVVTTDVKVDPVQIVEPVVKVDVEPVQITEPVVKADIDVEPVVAVEPVVEIDAVDAPDAPDADEVKANRKVKGKLHKLTAKIKHLSAKVSTQVLATINNVTADVDNEVNNISPQVSLAFKDTEVDNNYTVDQQDGNELVKNYSKTYSVDANDILAIANKYGSVTVNTWAKSEIKVDVQIKVGADNQSDAQKVLDNVTISDSKDGNTVAFKTNINEMKNGWMSIFKGGNSHHMEINYIVYMPARNELVIDNRYGGIVIPDMTGKVTIYSGYGSFKGGLLPNQSAIRVKYGSADIGSVGTCAMEVSYGSLKLGSADKLEANIDYSSAEIGKLHTSAAINVKYSGGLRIGDVDRNMKDLAINASYSNVDLGLSGDENANFEVTVHYGDFNYDGHDVTVTAKSPSDDDRGPHFTYNYKGHLGKGGSDKKIAINANYGNVKFN